MRYTLLLHDPEPADGELSPEEIEAGMRAFPAYAEALADAGALAWAEKCPAAHWGAVEIRPTAVHFVDRTWVAAG